MRQSKGFTVLEVLVAGSVFLVILVLLANVFLTALRRTEDGRLRVDLQQQAIFALKRWESDLQTASTRAMVISKEDPSGVALYHPSELNGFGVPNWKTTFVFWHHDPTTRTLVREEVDGSGGGGVALAGAATSLVPYLPSLEELSALSKDFSGSEKTLSRDVEKFSLTDANGYDSRSARVSPQPLLLEFRLRRALSVSERFTEFTIKRRYTLRNSYS